MEIAAVLVVNYIPTFVVYPHCLFSSCEPANSQIEGSLQPTAKHVCFP